MKLLRMGSRGLGITVTVGRLALIICSVVFLFCNLVSIPCASQLILEDVQVLMSVKQSLIDPQNETSGWDSGFTDPCSWHHVTCTTDGTAVTRLELGRLQLSGTISPEISKLPRLQILTLEDNNITGAIPQELGLLSNLNTLDLSNNQLTGEIPSSLGQLKNLNSLRLNNNNLSGPIPVSLTSIGTLSSVNFSFNNFSGQMPHLLAVYHSAEGNPYLCGLGTGHYCPGQEQSLPMNASQGAKSESNHVNKTALIVSLVVILPVSIGFGIWICWWRRRRLLNSIRDAEQYDLDMDVRLGQLKRYSLHELQQATDGFSIDNLLGYGGSGQVYKGHLQDGTVVAVKRLRDRNAVTQFKVELEMISLAAHRNLLRLQGFCMTSTELALVYPYMSNGSVASRLGEKLPLNGLPARTLPLVQHEPWCTCMNSAIPR